MKTITLGSTDLEVSSVSLGVMRIDSKSRDEAAAIVQKALDRGVTFFDTADIYGGGTSSVVFAQALKDLGVKRGLIQIQTKFGIVNPGGQGIIRYDFSKQHLLDAFEEEFDRLGVDYVDSLLLHRPDPLFEAEEVAEVFNELEASGRVKHFGVSNMNPWLVELIQSAVSQKLEVNQLQFGIMHTHMIQQELQANMEDAGSVQHDGGMISYSRLRKMTVQAWSPFQYGFFEGPYVDNPKFPELNAELDKLAAKYGTSKNAIAVAWILRHPAKMQIILGSMNLQRLDEMIDGGDIELDRQDWWDLYVAAGNIIP